MKKSIVLAVVCLAGMASAQAPAGYYDQAQGLTGAALKTKLSEIISAGYRTQSYDALYTAYANGDIDRYYENDGSILDMYSENPNGSDPYNYGPGSAQRCGNYSSEGDCYNREHVMPQSIFNQNSPMVSDFLHIRPTDGKVNGMRGNYPFGVVGSATFTSRNGSKLGNNIAPGGSGTVFEPVNEFKGDIARMIFYFVTRYQNQIPSFQSGTLLNGTTYPSLPDWEKNLLLQWHAQDPVSPTELYRNNVAYTFQGNRNPFVDHPEYATAIWGPAPATTVDTQSPTAATNLMVGTVGSNSVALSWTAAQDNVAIGGYKILVNGALANTIYGNPTSTVVTGLTPSTTYNFSLISFDTSNNEGPVSNVVTATTTAATSTTPATYCNTETFTNLPASASSYSTVSWTGDNGISWTGTQTRTDQTLNGRAVCTRGSLTAANIPTPVYSVKFTAKLPFSDTTGQVNVLINGVSQGSITVNSGAEQTFTVPSTINTANSTLELQVTNAARVTFDDVQWTCTASTLGTSEVIKAEAFALVPNPTADGLVRIVGANPEKLEEIAIFTPDGRLVKKMTKPFAKTDILDLSGLPKGVYLIFSEKFSQRIIKK